MYVPPGAMIVKPGPTDTPLGLRSYAPRPRSCQALPDTEPVVIPAFRIKLPYQTLVVLVAPLKIGAVPVHVTLDQSIVAPRRGISVVTVWAELNAPSKITLSCGRGTRLVQFAALLQLPPLALTQCWSTGVVNVMPELPWASPRDVPVHGAAAPEPVISIKSTFVSDTAAAGMVRVAPRPDEFTSKRFVAELPVNVRVPVVVKAVTLKLSVFTAVPVQV